MCVDPGSYVCVLVCDGGTFSYSDRLQVLFLISHTRNDFGRGYTP